jgi:hypothetical protein
MQVSVTPAAPTVSPFLARLPTLTAGIQAAPEPPQNGSQTFPSLVGARALAADRPLSEQRPPAERSGMEASTGAESARGAQPASDAPVAALEGRSGSEQGGEQGDGRGGESSAGAGTESDGESSRGEDPTAPRGADGEPLTREEAAQLRELQARDREVRQHEQAHQTVGGRYAGSASYSYQRGPDGRAYAVGGEVPIDVSTIPGDPQATIRKMRIVRAAAMAPAEPSAADQQIAARANRTIVQAQAELLRQREAERAEAREGNAMVSEARGAAQAPPADARAGASDAAGQRAGPPAASVERSYSGSGAGRGIAQPDIMVARNALASRAYSGIAGGAATLAPASLFERVA